MKRIETLDGMELKFDELTIFRKEYGVPLPLYIIYLGQMSIEIPKDVGDAIFRYFWCIV